ncbi:MAG: 2Fe-2S iron-sulfur cluster binding domain-containing protein [Gammaproteobacteria bacterium]|nr:2Fe-2S iron-sulfur cluster binding domain-containing protein [Gammaproteobacteria bacterium]
MGTVTFLDPPFIGQNVAHTAIYGYTLLNLAGSLKHRLYAECRAGRCGACAVKVMVLGERGACKMQLGEIEKSILYQAGKLSREQYRSETPPDSSSLWRLACQYVVGNEEIVVAL